MCASDVRRSSCGGFAIGQWCAFDVRGSPCGPWARPHLESRGARGRGRRLHGGDLRDAETLSSGTRALRREGEEPRCRRGGRREEVGQESVALANRHSLEFCFVRHLSLKSSASAFSRFLVEGFTWTPRALGNGAPSLRFSRSERGSFEVSPPFFLLSALTNRFNLLSAIYRPQRLFFFACYWGHVACRPRLCLGLSGRRYLGSS